MQYIDSNTAHPRIALVSDTACNLPQSIIDKYNIHLIPFNVILQDTKYLDGYTISKDQFYDRLKNNNILAKTSQPAPAYFKKMYTSLLKHYDAVLSIHLSSPTSGAYQAAKNSAKEFDERVQVVDSKNITVGEGLMVKKAAEMIEQGLAFKEIIDRLEALRNNLQLFVSVPDVDTLMQSGRVSKAKGWLAKLLKIKPLITVNKAGVPVRSGKAFTRKGLQKKLTTLVEEFLKDKRNCEFMIAHANAPETAQFYAEFIKNNYDVDNVEIVHAAPVLASHTGLGSAGIGVYWED